jgi:hypothetical protein
MVLRGIIKFIAVAFLATQLWGQQTSAKLKNGGTVTAWVEMEFNLNGGMGRTIHLAYITFSNTGANPVEVEYTLHGLQSVRGPESGKVVVQPHKDGRRYAMRDALNRNARIGAITIKVRELTARELNEQKAMRDAANAQAQQEMEFRALERERRQLEKEIKEQVAKEREAAKLAEIQKNYDSMTVLCEKGRANSVFVHEGNVFVVGYQGKSDMIGSSVPALWVNERATPTNTQTNIRGQLNSVYVSPKGVFIAGVLHNNNEVRYSDAAIWTFTSSGEFKTAGVGVGKLFHAQAISVFVSGDDVYGVVNHSYGTAIVKNQTYQELSTLDWASSLFVSNNDIYIVGCKTYNGVKTPILWKNGTALPLAAHAERWEGGVKKRVGAKAKSIFVLGNDVYVLGESSDSQYRTGIILWKNNIPQYFESGSGAKPEGNSVFVSGTDVYVAGRNYGAATIWINGTPIPLDFPKTEEEKARNPYLPESEATSVFISDGDIYVAGRNREGQAVLWKIKRTSESSTSSPM